MEAYHQKQKNIQAYHWQQRKLEKRKYVRAYMYSLTWSRSTHSSDCRVRVPFCTWRTQKCVKAVVCVKEKKKKIHFCWGYNVSVRSWVINGCSFDAGWWQHAAKQKRPSPWPPPSKALRQCFWLSRWEKETKYLLFLSMARSWKPKPRCDSTWKWCHSVIKTEPVWRIQVCAFRTCTIILQIPPARRRKTRIFYIVHVQAIQRASNKTQ